MEIWVEKSTSEVTKPVVKPATINNLSTLSESVLTEGTNSTNSTVDNTTAPPVSIDSNLTSSVVSNLKVRSRVIEKEVSVENDTSQDSVEELKNGTSIDNSTSILNSTALNSTIDSEKHTVTAVLEMQANVPDDATGASLLADEDFTKALIAGTAASMGVDPSTLRIGSIDLNQ